MSKTRTTIAGMSADELQAVKDISKHYNERTASKALRRYIADFKRFQHLQQWAGEANDLLVEQTAIEELRAQDVQRRKELQKRRKKFRLLDRQMRMM